MEKIYISDLDGTLLRDDATLSHYSREKLKELMENGVNFTVASARSIVSIKKILKGVSLKLPVIEFNGAFISDFKTGKHKVINEIDREITKEIFSLIKTHNCIPFISSFNGEEDCLYYHEILNEGMNWYLKNRIKAKDKRLRKIGNLEDSLNDDVVCFTVINKKEEIIELKEEINEKFGKNVEIHFTDNQYSTGWHWFTLHDWRATKDQAIKILIEELDLSFENLTVFGDNVNDIKMFKIASGAIAVANATKELKKYATKVIGTNEEDSVVNYIIKDYFN